MSDTFFGVEYALIGVSSLVVATLLAAAYFVGELRRAKRPAQKPQISMEIRYAGGQRLVFRRVTADNPALLAAIKGFASEAVRTKLSGGLFDFVWEIEVPHGEGVVDADICSTPEALTVSDPLETEGASSGPIVIEDSGRPSFPSSDFARRVASLEHIIQRFTKSLDSACEVAGELTKSLLSDGIATYEERYVLEDNYAVYFVNEFRLYEEALNNPSDRIALERALTFGKRLRIEYDKRDIDLAAFCEGISNHGVCAVVSLASLFAIKAGFKKKK